MSSAAPGPMLVVDASVLFEVLSRSARAESFRLRLGADEDQIAPEVIDVEVFGVIRGQHLSGTLDRTAAELAVADLREWPGQRFPHRNLLARAWGLRANVRGWDAFYVALAESFDATLVTTDARLARSAGPECRIEVW